MINLYFLDLLGTFSFSFFGAYVGLKNRLDLFGIFVCALLSGLGGGTIREIILNKTPVYFTDTSYLFCVAIGFCMAIFLYNNFSKIQKYYLVVDAIGLSTFAFIGAQQADIHNLGSIAIIFFATLNAVGGGILRDISIRKVPYIFSKDFYATPAIILGIIYSLLKVNMNNFIFAYSLLIFIFVLRLTAIRFNFKLWAVKHDNKSN